ncbi:MAG: hypothetical protein ACHRXM_18710 [Isosphaerales bacterium]
MHPTRRSDSFAIDETVAGGDRYSIPEYLETIALLHEEVARLEQELQLRGDSSWETVSTGVASAEDEVMPSSASASAAASQGEVERLRCELANREETVALLLDQLSLLEEAKAANRSEWEQLTEWVAELEQRVEGQDEDALRRLQARLGDQQREAEELRTKSEQHRRGWEVQRQVYEKEIARLQARLAQAQASPPALGDDDGQADPGSGPDVQVVKALQEENLRLRARQDIVERTAAENSNALHSRLGEVQNERDERARQLEQVHDERRRERLEYETTVAELRTRLSEASLVQPEATLSVKQPECHVRDMEPDLRVRALRQHLLEIHQREEEDRRQRSLTGRLSRLWSRTGPR